MNLVEIYNEHLNDPIELSRRIRKGTKVQIGSKETIEKGGDIAFGTNRRMLRLAGRVTIVEDIERVWHHKVGTTFSLDIDDSHSSWHIYMIDRIIEF